MRSVMRHSRYVALAILLTASACGDLKDIMAVSTAVQEHYHMPASINLNNGSHLAITFQNASVQSLKLDSAGLDGFARGVAAFAKAHYAKAPQLEDVTVAFATVSSTGPLTVTRTEAPYRYRASELK
jgi:hypothetical protein